MTPHDHDSPYSNQRNLAPYPPTLSPEPEQKPEATCVEFKPTIWHRLGFGECSPPMLEDEDYPHLAPASMTTEVRIHFGWKDRLRLLLTGWAMVATRTKTELPVEGQVVSTSAASVMQPGWEKHPR